MALIDLKLIGGLALQGFEQKFTLQTMAYNVPGSKATYDDSLFVMLFKMSEQSNNLFEHLKKLHQVCTDLAANNIQPYADDYADCAEGTEDEGLVYNPFGELIWCINSQTVSDMPPMIQQYSELLHMAQTYGAVEQKKREGFRQFFGAMPVYQMGTNEFGESVAIQMSEDDRAKHDLKEDIKAVEVEYCLDRYNEFYARCLALIESYKPSDDYISCSIEILKMFAPYNVNLTPARP